MRARLAALWAAFVAVHVVVAVSGWILPSQPMGDVVLVYEPWAAAALDGRGVVGITETWVYPQLALVPMLAAKLLAAPLAPLLGVSGAYLVAWAVLVTLLDALAFRMLLGARPSAARQGAAWFWTAALLLLGPITLYRIDAITVPVALAGALMLLRRPRIAAALLTVGAWIKIWPGALLLAGVVAATRRLALVVTAALTAVVIAGALLLLGAGEHLLGFLGEQTGRGLQVEAVAATPYLWLAAAGAASIDYSFEILTFQVAGPGVDAVAAVLTPLMVVLVIAVTALGVVAAVRGARPARLLPPLALALVVVLIVANKVGSPQFQTWLLVPAMLWLLLDRRHARGPIVSILALCALTCVIYPLTYDALLRAELIPVILVTLRNALLLVLLGLGIRSLVALTVRTDPRR